LLVSASQLEQAMDGLLQVLVGDDPAASGSSIGSRTT
jgi:hypothetical protein